MTQVRLLMVGDVTAKAGLRTVKRLLGKVIADRAIDFVIANGENVAGGVGITPDLADDLFKQDIDVLTTGNHVWRQRDIRAYIDREPRLLRPLNFPASQPGAGYGVYETVAGVKVGVINLIGQVYMDPAENPFVAADAALAAIGTQTKLIVVDMHAEATSEKRAMGWYLDGKVTAVLGTHTHVPTGDEQIMPGGTAFLTDVGMTGPHDSVIGMRKELVIARFSTGLPQSFKPSNKGARLQAVLVEASAETGLADLIERIDIPLGE